MAKLTPVQLAGLVELAAAVDEAIRYYGKCGGVRTSLLSGDSEVRSAKNMRSLVALGLVEGDKPTGYAQTQWVWRITEAGRSALREAE